MVFVGVIVAGLAVVSIVSTIPNAIRDFQPPSADVLLEISGPPTDIDASRVINRRGTYTTFSFKVNGRSFFLPSYDWDGPENLTRIEQAIIDCESVSLKIFEDESKYTFAPFWELKADGQTIVSQKEMLDKHNLNRLPALLAPLAFILIILTGAGISLVFYLRK